MSLNYVSLSVIDLGYVVNRYFVLNPDRVVILDFNLHREYFYFPVRFRISIFPDLTRDSFSSRLRGSGFFSGYLDSTLFVFPSFTADILVTAIPIGPGFLCSIAHFIYNVPPESRLYFSRITTYNSIIYPIYVTIGRTAVVSFYVFSLTLGEIQLVGGCETFRDVLSEAIHSLHGSVLELRSLGTYPETGPGEAFFRGYGFFKTHQVRRFGDSKYARHQGREIEIRP